MWMCKVERVEHEFRGVIITGRARKKSLRGAGTWRSRGGRNGKSTEAAVLIFPQITAWTYCPHGKKKTGTYLVAEWPQCFVRVMFYLFIYRLIVKYSPERTKTDSEVILLTNIDCVVTVWFMCATDGHCVFNSFLTTIELFGSEEQAGLYQALDTPTVLLSGTVSLFLLVFFEPFKDKKENIKHKIMECDQTHL